jgi:outer membrane biosynthesis protein TonB
MRILLGAILGMAMASSPLLARQEPADKEKQKQQEPKTQEPPSPKANTEKKQEAPAKKQEPPPSAKQEKSDDKHQQQDAKQQQKEMEKQSKDSEKKNRESSQQPQPQQRQQNSRQQYAQGSHPKGERIPPQKFDESFGSEHHFRVKHLQEGRRFEYSGYAFELVEPWPAGWSYEDECYIVEDEDDYYLVDVFHPDIRVLVIVV